eukprot:scaffold24698_cov63-Phaeocystis_antarctica.AAC.5
MLSCPFDSLAASRYSGRAISRSSIEAARPCSLASDEWMIGPSWCGSPPSTSWPSALSRAAAGAMVSGSIDWPASSTTIKSKWPRGTPSEASLPAVHSVATSTRFFSISASGSSPNSLLRGSQLLQLREACHARPTQEAGQQHVSRRVGRRAHENAQLSGLDALQDCLYESGGLPSARWTKYHVRDVPGHTVDNGAHCSRLLFVELLVEEVSRHPERQPWRVEPRLQQIGWLGEEEAHCAGQRAGAI